MVSSRDSPIAPVRDGIPHVAREDIVGMFRVQRNDAEDVHVLVQDDDLRRGLDELLWEEPQHHNAW